VVELVNIASTPPTETRNKRAVWATVWCTAPHSSASILLGGSRPKCFWRAPCVEASMT